MRLLLLLLFTPIAMLGQEYSMFSYLVDEVKSYLNDYYKLTPNESYYNISNFNLHEEYFTELKRRVATENSILNNLDSIDYMIMFDFLQEKLIKSIEQVAKHPEFKKQNILELFSDTKLSVIASDDKKLYNFIFDENAGGNYHSVVSIVHYTDFVLKDSSSNENFQKFFPSNGFEKVYNLKTDEGTKYIITGMIHGCLNCFDPFLYLIKFADNKFVKEFSYSLRSSESDCLIFDPKTKTVYVNYLIDEYSSDCQCTNEVDNNNSTDDQSVNEDEVARCFCEFVFNGRDFSSETTSFKKNKKK